MGIFTKKIKLADYLGAEIDSANINVKEIVSETYSIEKLAIRNAISYIANAISNSEFKVYERGKAVKDDVYYRLNVSPNTNDNASKFWNKVITRMYLDGKAVVFEYHRNLFVADSYGEDKNSIKGHTYNDIALNDSDLTFNKKAKDVLVFEIDNPDYIDILKSAMEKYANIFSNASKAYINANAESWLYEVDSYAHGDDDFNEKWKSKISKSIKTLLDSQQGIMPVTRGEKLTRLDRSKSSTDSSSIVSIRQDIFDTVANSFKMPTAMFTGNINNLEEVVNVFLTFCIDPIADMISKELTRKLCENYEEGNYIVVDTSCVTHYDLFSISDKADKLIASGLANIDELRSKVNLEPRNTGWSTQHWFTKNYAKIDDVLKGGENSEEK